MLSGMLRAILRLRRPTPLLAFGLLGCVFLFAWSEITNWQAQLRITANALGQNAEAIARNADDMFEYAEPPITTVALAARRRSETSPQGSELGRAQELTLDAIIAQELSFRPIVKGLAYIDRDTTLVAGGRAFKDGFERSQLTNLLLVHRNSTYSTSKLGSPQMDRAGHWVIPISQRVSRKDGSFQGIVVALFELDQFADFFRNFQESPEDIYVLLREDGEILARSADDNQFRPGSFSNTVLFTKHLRRQPIGSLENGSEIDRVRRVVSFYQSQTTGIIAIASSSAFESFRKWASGAMIRWAYASGLFLVIGLLAYQYHRQLRLRIATEARLAAQSASFRLMAECSSDLIEVFNKAGLREYASPSSENILGISAGSLIGQNFFARFSESNLAAVLAAIARLEEGSQQEKVIYSYVKPTGHEVWLETALGRSSPSDADEDLHIVAATRDVTRHKKMEEELGLLANTDELTALANRRLFNLKLGELTAQGERARSPVSLLMIDADRFKLFNDTYGHSAGDDCLRMIAGAVKDVVRGKSDIAARYGGEELAVLLYDTDENGASAVAERIRSKIVDCKIRHEKNHPSRMVTVSIGVATLAPFGDYDPRRLVNDADQALYEAKGGGRDRVVTWSSNATVRKHTA